MLERALKSSRLFEMFEKLHVDFPASASMGRDMADDDEIDPAKVRSGLFALITARLEDAHEIAVKGQATKISVQDIGDLVVDLRSALDETTIHIDAIKLMNNR